VNQLVNWSFSKLLSYEQCAFRVKLRYIEKIPEPPRDPNNDPLARGDRIHKNLEAVIKGTEALGTEARKIDEFKPMLERLNALYECGMATSEDDWTYNADWDECGKKDYWLWAKVDYNVHDDSEGLIITGDWKSGKSYYKMAEHLTQTQLYAGISALRFPDADRFITEIPYVDEGHILSREYTRAEALQFIKKFNYRAERMLADKWFKPNANKHTCKFCPYSPRGNGHCPVGV
jgi:CRISPR/Cas system-associated exonuclease Cas4 (RecB family)